MLSLRLNLDDSGQDPLYRQLYEQIRDLILSGELGAGTRLPSSRRLAGKYGIARITVTAAYQQLQIEGYVVSLVGSGTYVSKNLPEHPLQQESEITLFEPNYSSWGNRVMETNGDSNEMVDSERPDIDFGFGRSFPHIFPYDIWRRLLDRYLSTDDTMLSHYGSAAGFDPLRRAVADYLTRLRGVKCIHEQVVIVSGIQQALDIISRLLLEQGDEILVETPGYSDAFELLRTFGANLRAIPVDEDGFSVEQIPSESNARLIFVTPSNQFPRGGTMPLSRRLALLDWAKSLTALILEDDYDGELRYSSHPIAALQGLDDDGRIIYLGTFSKVLFPTLRLGYVVLPFSLLSPFLKAKALVDRGAPTLTQAAVADFINEGHFERHLRRLRKEYGQRRKVLVDVLESELPGMVNFSRVEAGLHVMLYLQPELSEELVVQRALSNGVKVYPGAPYHLEESPPPSILLGFSGLTKSEIHDGVTRLASIIKEFAV